MSTKSSRVLHRTFLACTLCVLLLVPQIGATGTAFAAKSTAKFPTPVSLAVANSYCLNLGTSAVVGSQKIAVFNPPGQAVSFTFVIVLFNNCGTTIMSGATVTVTSTNTCPDANSTPSSSSPVSQAIGNPIVDRKRAPSRQKTSKENTTMELAESVVVIPFPVYGVVGNPLSLRLHSYGGYLGYSGFIIRYKSPCYPEYPNILLAVKTFQLTSIEGSHPFSTKDHILEKVLEEQPQPVPSPLCWEGVMTIANTRFHGTIAYYSPLTISTFVLRSEKTALQGRSYGPSYDDLIELLKGLQVLNGHDDVLRQNE
jgi:hypothetical protein